MLAESFDFFQFFNLNRLVFGNGKQFFIRSCNSVLVTSAEVILRTSFFSKNSLTDLSSASRKSLLSLIFKILIFIFCDFRVKTPAKHLLCRSLILT